MQDRPRFDALVLPHLNAAYNLARWLTRSDVDAQDVVQEAMARAIRYLPTLRGLDARPWLLAIVRNECLGWLRRHRPGEAQALLDEEAQAELPGPSQLEPETAAIQRAEVRLLNEAIAALPPAFREAIVLRELEGLSYREIAGIAGVPMGTVMSRLARGRRLLAQSLHVIAVASDRTPT